MGMYTELVIKCAFKDNLPPAVLNVLLHMFENQDLDPMISIPAHPFFECQRWSMLGSCSSHYHHPKALSNMYKTDYMSNYTLFSRSDLKNYDDEINKFLDWVYPYIDEPEGQCIGWSWYEERQVPDLIIMGPERLMVGSS